jgi:hypothetical protein
MASYGRADECSINCGGLKPRSAVSRQIENGKRQINPLGRDIQTALIAVRKMEFAREEKPGVAAHQPPTASPDFKSWTETRFAELQTDVARLTEQLQVLLNLQTHDRSIIRTLEAQVASLSGFRHRSREVKRQQGVMAIEKHYSLRAAARLAGVGPHALRHWPEQDGICVPKVRRGQRILVRERDVERVLEKRRDARATRI